MTKLTVARSRETKPDDGSNTAHSTHPAKATSLCYEPLDPDVDSFRLLTIERTEDDDLSIVCQMTNVTFKSNPKFEALSYRWGDPSIGGGLITLNGAKFHVGQNLLDGLRCLRSHSRTLPIWIDAICINQDDLSERNRQVKIMHHIYGRATTVIVWLGEKYCNYEKTRSQAASYQGHSTQDDTHGARDMFGLFRERFSAYMHKAAEISTPNVDGTSEKDLLTKDLLADLCIDEYWRRVWIIQEIGKAQNILLIFGDSSPIEWDDFISLVVKHRLGSDGPVRLNKLYKDRGGGARTLRRLLEDHRDALCSERRDKIYGLIGLAVDVHGLQIDYGKPLIDVWTDLLHNAGYNRLVEGPDLIPFAHLVKTLLEGPERTPLDCTEKLKPLVKRPFKIREFTLPGYIVGQVAHIGPRTGQIISTLALVDKWDSMVHDVYRDEIALAQDESRKLQWTLLNPPKSVENVSSYVSGVRWKTPPSRSGQNVMEAYLPRIAVDQALEGELAENDQNVDPNLFLVWNQRKGNLPWKMGVTSQQTREGDLIVWVRNARQAVVVRAIGDSNNLEMQVIGRALMTEDLAMPDMIHVDTEHNKRLRWFEDDEKLDVRMDVMSLYLLVS